VKLNSGGAACVPCTAGCTTRLRVVLLDTGHIQYGPFDGCHHHSHFVTFTVLLIFRVDNADTRYCPCLLAYIKDVSRDIISHLCDAGLACLLTPCSATPAAVALPWPSAPLCLCSVGRGADASLSRGFEGTNPLAA